MTALRVSGLVRVAALMSVVVACNGLATPTPGTGSGRPPADETPTTGEVPSGELPSDEPPTDGRPTDEPTSGEPSGELPAGGPNSNAFSEPAEDTFIETPAYSSRASFGVEGRRRAVVVTVFGANPDAVKAYTDEAVFSFEIQDAPAPAEALEGSDAEADEEAPVSLAPERLLEAPDSQNLSIEFRLTDGAAGEMETGQLIVTVDPTIPGGAYHNFYMRDPASETGDTVEVEMTLSAGEASAYLYRNCELAAFSRRTAATSPGRLRGSGPGRFDFVVAGRDSPSSTYRLRGSWYYSYAASVPSATAAQVGC